jgi:hypothetical protein
MGRREISKPFMILAVLALPAGMGGCMKSATYGTGENPEMAVFREMTGGFMSKRDKPQIAYEPRAPLVMPPNPEQLPPPVETAAATDTNWPVDPSARAAANEASSKENTQQEEYQRLKPLGGLFANVSRERDTRANNDKQRLRDDYYAFIEQGKKRDDFAKAVADAKGYNSNERRYLTDPPLAYRQPAGTAPTEYKGVGKKRGFFAWIFPGSS